MPRDAPVMMAVLFSSMADMKFLLGVCACKRDGLTMTEMTFGIIALYSN